MVTQTATIVDLLQCCPGLSASAEDGEVPHRLAASPSSCGHRGLGPARNLENKARRAQRQALANRVDTVDSYPTSRVLASTSFSQCWAWTRPCTRWQFPKLRNSGVIPSEYPTEFLGLWGYAGQSPVLPEGRPSSVSEQQSCPPLSRSLAPSGRRECFLSPRPLRVYGLGLAGAESDGGADDDAQALRCQRTCRAYALAS